MKSVSAKRVFAITGIVVASVTALAGAIFGVMALMGKFKEPIAYPTSLEFAVTEQEIVAGNPFDPKLSWEEQFKNSETAPTLESFVISGTHPKYEVNQKSCYLEFCDTASPKLITLCEANGKPLTKDKNNRYLVNCNEPIYYMVNTLDNVANTNGVVKLKARSTNDTVALPSSPMTIYIDRKINEVYVKDADWGDDYFESLLDSEKNSEGNYVEKLNIGVGSTFDFTYVVKPELSLCPFADKTKNVELYYEDVNGVAGVDDYIAITEESIGAGILPSFLKKEEGSSAISFVPSLEDIGEYKFYIAVFKTFKAERDYTNSFDVSTLDLPNHHRITTKNSAGERYMAVTEFTVKVNNSEVSDVEFANDSLTLDFNLLNSLYLSNGTQKNNLGLNIYRKEENGDEVLDVDNYNNLQFTKPEVLKNGINFVEPIFKNNKGENPTSTIYVSEMNFANVFVGTNIRVIKSITQNGTTYYCSNGIAVYDYGDGKSKVLESGIYLSFYEKLGDDYKPYDIDYSVSGIQGAGTGNYADIYFDIAPTKTADAGTLYLGILAVNSTGYSDDDSEFKMFDAIETVIEEKDLTFDVDVEKLKLNITFDEGNVVNYNEIDFNDLIKNLSASYNACVLMVEENVKLIETVDTITYTDTSVSPNVQYKLVGYYDGDNFVNKIKINSDNELKKGENTCELYILQLKNNYGQTTEALIKELAPAQTAEISGVNVKSFGIIDEDNSTLTIGYEVNPDLIEIDASEKAMYEHTTLILEATTKHETMFDLLLKFSNQPTSITSTNIKVARVDMEGKKISLTITAEDYDADVEPVDITLTWVDHIFNFGKVIVKNAMPTQLKFTPTGELLHSDKAEALTADGVTMYVNHKNIEPTGVDYRYLYQIGSKGSSDPIADHLFNSTLAEEDAHFVDNATDKGQQPFHITYSLWIFSNGSWSKIEWNEGNLIKYLQNSENQLVLGVEVRDKEVDHTRSFVQYIKIKASSDFEFTTDKIDITGDSGLLYVLDDSVVAAKLLNEELTDEYIYCEIDNVSVTTEKELSVEDIDADNLEEINGTFNIALYPTHYGWVYYDGTNPVLVIYKDATSGWTFQRISAYNSFDISFKLHFFGESIDGKLAFTSNINISVNKYWSEYPEFYAGTSVMLGSNGDNSVFKIENNGSDTISYKLNNNVTFAGTELELLDSHIGNLRIEVLVNGAPTNYVRKFTVKSNVVATLSGDEFISETSYDIALNSYIDTTYGSNAGAFYWNEDGTRSGYLNETYSGELKNEVSGIVSISENKISIGKIEELGATKTVTFTLKDGSGNKIEDFTITVKNKYGVVSFSNTEFTYNQEITKDILTVGTYSSGTYSDNIVNTNLVSITTVANNSGKFNGKIVNEFVDKDTIIEETLIIRIDGKEYTYNTELTIKPYEPTKLDPIEPATAGSNYNIFKQVYGTKLTDFIKELKVVGIYDLNGDKTDYTYIEGTAYNQKDGILNYTVRFNDFSGPEKRVKIRFEVTYIDSEVTHTYEVEIEVVNRQSLVVKYPEGDMKLKSGTFQFMSGCEADAKEFESDSLTCRLTDLSYEAVLIYTDKQSTLNFTGKDNKQFERVKIGGDNQSLTIKLVAYQGLSGMPNYVNRLNQANNFNNNQVIFPTASQNFSGALIFKLTTESLNFKYYVVYVYCAGASTGINSENNIEVILGVAGKSLAYTNTNNTKGFEIVQVDTNSTYDNILTQIKATATYENTFGSLEYNKIYLYHDADRVPGTRNVTDDGTISFDKNFRTLTLGLIYEYGISIYCLGTITLYVQPATSIEFTNSKGFDYDIPNGVFTKRIETAGKPIECPFGTDWTAEIVDGTGEVIDGTNSVKIGYFLEEKTVRVKYSKDGTEGITEVFVTYTQVATELPEDGTITKVGGFDGEKFVTSINLKDDVNINKFFRTYGGDVSYGISGSASMVGDTINFDQDLVEQEVTLTITYSEMTGDNTRTFKFIVEPGIYVAATGAGINSSNPFVTTETNAYNQSVGSEAKIVVSEDLSIYSIGGLTIHSIEPLQIDFDRDSVSGNNPDIDYSQFVTLNSNTFEFVHLAKATEITLNILFKDDSANVIHHQTFFFEVSKTYSYVEAAYLTPGATHENVINGSKLENAHNSLFNSGAKKFKLYDEKGTVVASTVDLLAMGFNEPNNPNYITLSITGNGSIETTTDTIKFSTVALNSECTVRFENKAGLDHSTSDIKYNRYKYQIMTSTTDADGLNYSTSDGICDKVEKPNYVSFNLDDFTLGENFTKDFVLGTMKDLENSTVFIVNGEKGAVDDNKIKIALPNNNESYTTYLLLDLNTRKVILKVERAANNNYLGSDLIEIKNISIGGVNGAETITKGLTIVLNNFKIETTYVGVDTVYGGYLINLTNKFKATNGDGTTYNLVDCNYTYTEDKEQKTIDSINNDLFEYDEDNQSIQFYHVGVQVTGWLKFNVVKDGYILASFQYENNINVNLAIVVNGDDVKDNKFNTKPETNFVINNAETPDFSSGLEFNFKRKANVKDYSKEESGNMFYKELVFDLYTINDQNTQGAPSILDASIGVEGKNVEGVYEVTNSGIKFYTDYSGEIELTLKVETDCGVYSVEWTIYVTPIYSLKTTSKNDSVVLGSLKNDTLSFNTGTSVEIISGGSDVGVGIIAEKDALFNEDLTLTARSIKYSYVITDSNDSKITNSTNHKKLYDEGTPSPTITGTFANDDWNIFTVVLPYIPVNTTCYVTYKVDVSYFGNTKTFYVTYCVQNIANIAPYDLDEGDTYKWSSVICLDGRSELEINNLDLFYFKAETTNYEVYYDKMPVKITDIQHNLVYTDYSRDADNNFTFTLDEHDEIIYNLAENKINGAEIDSTKYKVEFGTEIKIKSGSTIYTQSAVNGKEYTFSDSDGKNTIKYKLASDGQKATIDGKELETQTRYEYKDETNNVYYYSVFNHEFEDVFEFKHFIDEYLGKKCVKIGDKEFTLVYFGDGRFGINLLEDGKFSTKDVRADLVVGNNDLLVAAYDNDSTPGFRIYSTTTVSPKDPKTLDALGLTRYATAYNIDENTIIIGIGTDATDNDWVNEPTADSSDADDPTTKDKDEGLFGELKIANVVYQIRKVNYSIGSGVGCLSETETHYYIDADEIIVPKYGINVDHFKVTLDSDYSYDLNNLSTKFKVLKWNNGIVESTDTITISAPATANDGVTIKENTLKLTNTSNLTRDIKFKVNGVEVTCRFKFSLTTS